MILTKLKQSGFLLRTEDGSLFAFDAGSETPVSALPVAIQAAFVSHHHGDHFSEENVESIGKAYVARDIVERSPQLEATALVDGEPVQDGPLTVTPFPVSHGSAAPDIVNLGFLIEADGKRLLFLGDIKEPSPAPEGPFDAVLVPVSGKYVFDPSQAFEYVQTLGEVKLLLPIHFDGSFTDEVAYEFEALAKGKYRVAILKMGDEITIS